MLEIYNLHVRLLPPPSHPNFSPWFIFYLVGATRNFLRSPPNKKTDLCTKIKSCGCNCAWEPRSLAPPCHCADTNRQPQKQTHPCYQRNGTASCQGCVCFLTDACLYVRIFSEHWRIKCENTRWIDARETRNATANVSMFASIIKSIKSNKRRGIFLLFNRMWKTKRKQFMVFLHSFSNL